MNVAGMSGKSYLPVLGDRGCPARHRLILPLRCPRGLAPTSPARWALAPPGGGLAPASPARRVLAVPGGGLAPASPARRVLAVPGGGLNPSGTCSPCPGGEDHLKRRSSSPPVPPLLGYRHCSRERLSVGFTPNRRLPCAGNLYGRFCKCRKRFSAGVPGAKPPAK